MKICVGEGFVGLERCEDLVRGLPHTGVPEIVQPPHQIFATHCYGNTSGTQFFDGPQVERIGRGG